MSQPLACSTQAGVSNPVERHHVCNGHPCTNFPWGASTGKVPILTPSRHTESFPPTYPVFLPAGWEIENPSKGTTSHSPREQGVAAERHRFALLHFPLHLLIPEWFLHSVKTQPPRFPLLCWAEVHTIPPSPALALQWKYSSRGLSTRTRCGCRLLSVNKTHPTVLKTKAMR